MKNKMKSNGTVRAHLTNLRLSQPLAKFWLDRYRFNRRQLDLDEEKAMIYADRTVFAFKKTNVELAIG